MLCIIFRYKNRPLLKYVVYLLLLTAMALAISGEYMTSISRHM